MMQNLPKCSVVLHKLPDVIAGGGKFTDLQELSLAPGRVKSEASSMPHVLSISATVIPPEPMKEEQNETQESITVKEEPIFHETDKTQAGDASKLSSLGSSAGVFPILPAKREADFDSHCDIQQTSPARRCHDTHTKVESGSAAPSRETECGSTLLLKEGTTQAACSSVTGVAQFAYGTNNKNSSQRGESCLQQLSSSGPCRYIWNKFMRPNLNLDPIMEISSSSLNASPCPPGDHVLGDISSTQTICVSRKIVPAEKKISRSASPVTNSSEATCHDEAVGVEVGLQDDSDRPCKMSCKLRCSKPQMFKCSECSFAYSKKTRLRTHIQRRHSGRKPMGPSHHFVKCAQCDHNGDISYNVLINKILQGCPSKKPRFDHVSNSNDRFEAQRTAKHSVCRQFYCPTCDFSSTYKGRLIRHILNSHPSDFHSPICSQCEFLCLLSKLFAQNL